MPATGDGGDGGGGGGPQVTPAQLAAQAVELLPIEAPRVRTSPPRGVPGLVNVEEWFWLAPGQREPVTQRVEAGGVWAEATARPLELVVDPGPGLPEVHCDGVGRPYDPGEVASAQSSSCTYTYQRSSASQPSVGGVPHAYEVTVTVIWGGSWRGSDGSGGALPTVARSTTFPLQVAESQALVGRSS